MSVRGNDDGSALSFDFVAQAVGVVGLVGKHLFGLEAVDQAAGRGHIVLLAGTKIEANWQARCIDYGVGLGSEAATNRPRA